MISRTQALFWCFIGTSIAWAYVFYSSDWIQVETPLEQCRQQYNVYQCEMIAVPIEVKE